MTDDLRVAVGADTVSVPVDRPHVERGVGSWLSPHVRDVTDSRLLILIIISVGLGVGAVLAVTTGKWWIVPLAFVLISGFGLMIVKTVLQMTGVLEHPSATTAAAMQADGVLSPDEFFSAAVAEFTESPNPATGGDRNTAVEDDPAMAAAEQKTAMTPTSGPSKTVGP